MLNLPLRHLPAFIRLRARGSELRQSLRYWRGSGALSPAAEARRQHRLGALGRALRLYEAGAALEGEEERCRQLGLLTRRQHAQPNAAPWKLVWQADPAGLWERQWIYELLPADGRDEQVDLAHRIIHPRMIVVDNQLSPAKETYYRRAFEAGATVALLHLGDEWYKDDCGAYAWCSMVIRNYWSPGIDGFKDIHVVPVGYRAGFARSEEPPPAKARAHLWCFAGDPFKTSRADMLEHMRKLGGGSEHLARGFNNPAALPLSDYRALMENALFVPAPCGNENVESFRAWEALEAGAIPIIERRPGYDYFRQWLGNHPLPTVDAWSEAGATVRAILADGAEARRLACRQWWLAEKARLRANVAAALETADTHAGRLGLAAALGWG